MTAPWLEGLNPAQREAVTYGDGPLLVVAGAGTGKTRTLACRVAHLIDQGVAPDRILLLTFTRRAAGEMVQRARHLVGREAVSRVWGGTFHATANRLLRIYGRAVDLPPEFTVMDQGDAADMMNLIRTELGLAKGQRRRRFPNKQTLIRIYSHTVNAQRRLSDVLETYFPWCADDEEAVADIFRRYVEQKGRRHVLDYDDLLLYWQMLCAAPKVGRTVADRFVHVLVDEYQDTNIIQSEILRGMRQSRRSICAVGDDAQAIYSFRAATIQNILDFPQHFPGSHTVTLEENYRSTRPILAASNAVMEQAKKRYTKNLRSDRPSPQRPVLWTCTDEAEQTDLVCSRILEDLERGIPLQRQAVLFRAAHHSAELEVELTRRNIPFHKYGGLKFVEAAHIKDVLAVLRVMENPFDEISWFRVLQHLEGIGPRTARRIMDALAMSSGEAREGTDAADGLSPLARAIRTPPVVPSTARDGFDALRAALADCSLVSLPTAPRRSRRSKRPPEAVAIEPGKGLPLTAQIERIRGFLEPIFVRAYENAPARLRDVEVLAQIAQRYRSRGRFITDLTLDPPAATSDLAEAPHLDEDFLILSTIHSSKGCEWTSVHILHVADGMIPSDMAVGDETGIEEERRLLYVAMTRAKDYLHAYFPLRYYHARFRHGDGHGYAQLSRYLTESVRSHFELRVAEQGDDDPPDAGARADRIATRLNRLWEP